MSRITAATRVIALLGRPVSHSLSPLMQNAAFNAAGLDAVYVAIECGEESIPALMESLAAGGGGGNVTLPHKSAAATAGVPDQRVTRLGVANVFSGASGRLTVSNTDVDGLLAAVSLTGVAATNWCVVGTGGSARAVAGAAAEAGASLAVISRDSGRAARFMAWAERIGVAGASTEECGLVFNATPVGLGADDHPPVDLSLLPALEGVVDLTYRAGGPTALVAQAERLGLPATDGREMLLIQGAAGWQHWFPGVEPPIEVMRAVLAGKMG